MNWVDSLVEKKHTPNRLLKVKKYDLPVNSQQWACMVTDEPIYYWTTEQVNVYL